MWAYLIQIAQGLQAMHSRNCLHRDVKAKNVFLTSKNHVRLGDLGCAKLLKAGLARTQIGTRVRERARARERTHTCIRVRQRPCAPARCAPTRCLHAAPPS